MSETIEYFSVELDTHEVMFAEGTAETFRYVVGQIAWDNLGDYQDVYGEHKVMSPFAPICSLQRRPRRGCVALFDGSAASRFVDGCQIARHLASPCFTASIRRCRGCADLLLQGSAQRCMSSPVLRARSNPNCL